MPGFVTAAEKRRRRAAYAAAAVLVVCAVALLLVPGSVETITGIRRAPRLAAPDDLPPLSSPDATPFFRDRDQIEIRVASATTLRQFLDRNRLNKPYTRKQIVDQLGNASPDAQIAAGTVFRIRLTPVAEDVPGAGPASK